MEFRNNRNNPRRRLPGADFELAETFLLRTPLLPFDELAAWGANLRAPHADAPAIAAAVEEDRRELRAWLRDLIARPEVLEALYVASPPLLEALDVWRADPDSKKGLRAEEALVRYAVRMTARATPFGLFAGCTAGRVGETTRLRLGERDAYRRHSRLDMDYVVALAHELNQDRALHRSFRWFPNSSLYRAAGRLRYAEARLDGRILSYHLVAVEPNEFLDAALARAQSGATMGEIAAAVVAGDPDGEIGVEDAESFVEDLVDSQLLVSDVWPAMTGPEAVDSMIETLARIDHEGASVLGEVQQELRTMDAHGLGHAPGRYRDLERRLEALPKRGDNRYLYHIDLFKDGEVVLGPAVADEIARGIEVLCRVSALPVHPLDAFRDQFVERYGEGRLVPLVEALDDEAGIGLPAVGTGAAASPLLAGLSFPAGREVQKIPWGRREEFLLAKLTAALGAGAHTIEITEEELAPFDGQPRLPLPDGFQAMVSLAAASEEAIAAGDFRVQVRSFFGPSGARIAGRFCHGDRRVAEGVLDHLRAEESLDPDVVFAEVVHLPTGRVGNISSRPLLRTWEIPFLGVSGAPRDRQIPIGDLFVTVAGGEVRLISKRLGKRVMPRLTSAHNFAFDSLALYHFLGMLQDQGLLRGLVWSWGVFARLPFLPRVCSGRLMLSPARWRVAAGELAAVEMHRGADRHLATRRWREQRGIPRQVLLEDGDYELFIDFENVLSLDTFFAFLRKNREATVGELWPPPAELPVTGPEGRFVSEFVVPVERRRAPTRRRAAPQPVDEAGRVLPPASPWLYLKIYTGAATADLLLRDTVAPLVEQAIGSGAADRWFFLRYGDPHWHLRVRFGGDAQRLQALAGAIGAQLEPELREGRIWRWQLDTYEREIERYGGPAGVELAERIFHADSEAVLAALNDLAGDEGAEARWRLALAGIDRLLDDFGCDLPAKRDVLAGMRARFAAEHEAGTELNQQLAKRLRDVRDELEELLAGEIAVFKWRSERLAPLIAELRAAESRGELTSSVDEMVPSFVHMFVNRLIRSDQRTHELVLYDFLHRLTASRIARAAPRSPAPDPTPAPAE